MTETIKDLENTVAAFAMAVRSADINWDVKTQADKWSNKEILGHLIDSAQINLQRFVRCTYEENFKLIYEQDDWVEGQAYQVADVANLVTLWIALNRQIIHVLSNFPADRLTATCDNNKSRVSLHTVEWLSADYVAHMQHHLNQILD